jgi:DNA-binding CsgD family transcriptional regulator
MVERPVFLRGEEAVMDGARTGTTLDSDRRLRTALSSFLTGGRYPSSVRGEIVASWRRAAASGLEPNRFEPPYDADVKRRGRLARAATPCLDQLGDHLAGTATSLLLTDERAHIVDRRVTHPSLWAHLDHIMLTPGFYFREEHVGTNGIGTALAQRAPAFVAGGEHYADVLTDIGGAGAPIVDPGTGQMLGIVNVTCSEADANPLMLPLARRAACEIGQRLLDGTSALERLLYKSFLHARRRAKGPLALVGESTMMTNPAAARILASADQPLLWEWAGNAVADGRAPSSELTLTNGAAMVGECEPVDDGGVMVGAAIRLHALESTRSGVEARGMSDFDRRPFGWNSLTETEKTVADLVASGLTNRQAAAQLFLSRHTVDAHLRHIYRKLDIRSRTELARLVAERPEERLSASA